jgi:hypothetical protein
MAQTGRAAGKRSKLGIGPRRRALRSRNRVRTDGNALIHGELLADQRPFMDEPGEPQCLKRA